MESMGLSQAAWSQVPAASHTNSLSPVSSRLRGMAGTHQSLACAVLAETNHFINVYYYTSHMSSLSPFIVASIHTLAPASRVQSFTLTPAAGRPEFSPKRSVPNNRGCMKRLPITCSAGSAPRLARFHTQQAAREKGEVSSNGFSSHDLLS